MSVLDLNNHGTTHPWSFTAWKKDLRHCHSRNKKRTDPIHTNIENPILQEARNNIPEPPLMLVLEVSRHFLETLTSFFYCSSSSYNDWFTLHYLPGESNESLLKSPLVALNHHCNKQNRILFYWFYKVLYCYKVSISICWI